MHFTIRLSAVIALCGAVAAAVAGRYDTGAANIVFACGVCILFVSIAIFLFVSRRESRGVDLTDIAGDLIYLVIQAIRK